MRVSKLLWVNMDIYILDQIKINLNGQTQLDCGQNRARPYGHWIAQIAKTR